jgi:hypothetical protein
VPTTVPRQLCRWSLSDPVMDRQQVLALVLAGLMLFSSVAYAVSFL